MDLRAAVLLLATVTPLGAACKSDLDCSLNGDCTAGKCDCDAAWCEPPPTLALASRH
jgi:hypothetical protein